MDTELGIEIDGIGVVCETMMHRAEWKLVTPMGEIVSDEREKGRARERERGQSRQMFVYQ